MVATASGTLIPLLIAVCLACAVWRLAGLRLRPRGRHPRTGPSYALAALCLCTALFLAIPLTVIWGLVLAGILAVCHIVGLWNLRPSRPA